MTFHRLTVPTYFGGLPGSYDYINNATAGTPALADGPRADSGPNNGTYFLGFGENARSQAANRGLKALAQNCDQLDDYVHRDVAVPAVTANVTAGGLVSSVVLPGPVFTGMGGTPNTVAGIRQFLTLVDGSDNEIFNTGAECQITAISPDTPGGLWSAGNVTLTISPAIPSGAVYRIYYRTRGRAATFLEDALVGSRRSFSQYHGGAPWADGTTNPATFVSSQLDKMLLDLGSGAGTAKVHAATLSGSPHALAAGSLESQISLLLAYVNSENGLWNAAVSAETSARAAALLALRADLHRVRFLVAADTINTPAQDKTIILNPAATFALQLPNPTTAVGHSIILINGNGLMTVTNKVTLTRFGSEKINNLASNFDLRAPYGRWILSCDGVDWHLV